MLLSTSRRDRYHNIDDFFSELKLPEEGHEFIESSSNNYDNAIYARLWSIRDYIENITGESYPIILDSPCMEFSDDECLSLFNSVSITNKQFIISTSFFLNILKEVDKNKINVQNCNSYLIIQIFL